MRLLSENGSNAPSLHDETINANSTALLRLFLEDKNNSVIILTVINVWLE